VKYFTRDLIERYGSWDDATANAASEEWEEILERYEREQRALEPELPEHIRDFTSLLLQDAIVWSIARQGDKLIIILRKDIPPQDVIIITYTLIEEPIINRDALSLEYRSEVMEFRCDEFELIRDGDRPAYAQSILFGNGWEMSLRFSDVQVSLAEPVYPLPGMAFVPLSTPAAASSL
jgi:hypothetical protein